MSVLPTSAQPTTIQANTTLAWVRRHPVPAFLLMVFSISWLLLLPPLLSTNGLGVLPISLPLQPFILLTALFGLALPAALVSAALAGKAGVKALFRGAIKWRVGPQWYLFALFALPLLAILTATLWLGAAPVQALAGQWPLFFTGLLPNALLIAVLISIWEETAWTGFMLAQLQPRFGPVWASLAVNCCQALLHVPLLFILGGLSDTPIPVAHYPEYLLYLFVFTIAMRFVMTWLFNATAGSLLIVALFHASWNVTAGASFVPAFTQGTDMRWVYAILAGVAVIVLLATHGRLSYRGQSQTHTHVAA